VLSDFRYAIRSFGRSPVLFAVALLSMTLGIGANTAIFSILNQMLLRLAPVDEPGRLVVLKNNGPNYGRTWNDGTNTSFSHPLYRDFATRTDLFKGVLARFQAPATLTHKGVTERATAEMVSGSYFDVLGVSAALGRTLTPDDDRTPGAHPVIVLSHKTWQSRFASNPAILNQSILVDGHPMTVVGVAQPGFGGYQAGSSVDFFITMSMAGIITPGWKDLNDRRRYWLQIVARLRDGVSAQQAEVALNTFYKPILQEDLKTMTARSERARREYLDKTITLLDGSRGHSPLRNEYSRPLIVLMTMVGLVLLIACANVANLLLSRAAGRQKEIAIRISVGASRGRLISQLLTESLTLSIAGGVLGLLLAVWITQGLIAVLPNPDLTRAFDAGLDLNVLLFCAAISLLTGLLFGLAPALQATRPKLADTLKDQAASTTGGAAAVTLRKALVVAQVALSLILLIGAGLFARSLYNLRSVNTGYQTDRLLAFSIDPSLNAYTEPQVLQAYDRIQRSLAALPGVRAVSMSAMPLLAGSYMGLGLEIPGYKPKDGEEMSTLVNVVGPNFLSTTGLPLLNGRDIQERDGAQGPKSVIVNETLARKYFGQDSPIGRHLVTDSIDFEIVGVVRDFKHGDVRDKQQPFIFIPYRQWPRPMAMTFYVNAAGNPKSLAEAITRTVRGVDANLPIYDLKTLEQQTAESLFLDRAIATFASAFGLLATLLAAIGLYGVMAYSVARRTREIGIRIALGAAASDVRGMIMRQVVLLVAIGIVIAIPVALALARYVESQLFGLAPTDPATILTAAAIIAAAGALSGLVPAMRAVRIDPTVALRYE
jgi:predicted permease